MNSTFFDLGTGGVRVGVSEVGVVSDPSSMVFIQNNYIQHGGYVTQSGCGILVQEAWDVWIFKNEISDFSYTGISLGWTWEYQPTSCYNNSVRYNHIHDIGRYELSDMGGIYTLGISSYTDIYNNLIHDIYTFDYGAWPIYLDQASTDFFVTNNVAYSCKSAPFHQVCTYHFFSIYFLPNLLKAFWIEEFGV